MRIEISNYRRTVIILLLATIAATIYIISLKVAYPIFQNTHLSNPLAELHSLFPLYYIAIIIMALSGALCFIFGIKNQGVHILILVLLAIMLWYTKYYLAGFTWEPDSARNLSVSLKIPEILNGYYFPNVEYGAEFPVPYILEYAIVGVSGASNAVYLHLIPFIFIIIFAILIYTLLEAFLVR